MHNNPLIYVDPTGHYCVSKTGNDAHGGECNSKTSKDLGNDWDNQFAPIIEKGQFVGIIGAMGEASYFDKPLGDMNYWQAKEELAKRQFAAAAASQQAAQLKLYQMQTFMENISGVSTMRTITSSNDPVEIWIGMMSMVGPPNGPKVKMFPDNPNSFKPTGLVKREYNSGKIIKWFDPKTEKAVFEWNLDSKFGNHFHITPDGNNRMTHPITGDTHLWTGDPIPNEYLKYFEK